MGSQAQDNAANRPSDIEATGDRKERGETMIKSDGSVSIFQSLRLRACLPDFDDLIHCDQARLAAQLSRSSTTAKDMASCLQISKSQRSTGRQLQNPIGNILEIPRGDTMQSLQDVNQRLDGINLKMLDDVHIQKAIVDLRQTMASVDIQLSYLEDNFQSFIQFLSMDNERDSNTDQRSGFSQSHTPGWDIVKEISAARQKAKATASSLMASMSIVESEKGIAEAESVSKLTELAFLYIPLTFSASLFSMQVKELSGSNISIGYFLLTAIVVAVVSYSIRLVIRSRFIISKKAVLAQNVRSDQAVAEGAPIPTRNFIRWAWLQIAGSFLILGFYILAPLAVLTMVLPVLWTRDIDNSTKVKVTAALASILGTWLAYWLYRLGSDRSWVRLG